MVFIAYMKSEGTRAVSHHTNYTELEEASDKEPHPWPYMTKTGTRPKPNWSDASTVLILAFFHDSQDGDTMVPTRSSEK